MVDSRCSVDGCIRVASTKALCNMHYSRLRRIGEVGEAESRLGRPRLCSVDGCGRKRKARGLCPMHYDRVRRHGALGTSDSTFYANKGNPCSVAGCSRLPHSRGLCPMHYQRWRKTGDPGEAESRAGKLRDGRVCAVEWCERPVQAIDWCATHYSRHRNGTDLDLPVHFKRTGRYVRKDGYVMVRVNGAYAPEHRHVMEQHLGRQLLPSENVHHLNGVRHDNRLDNLELWTRSQPCGQRVEDKVAWAIELLRLYRPDALA